MTYKERELLEIVQTVHPRAGGEHISVAWTQDAAGGSSRRISRGGSLPEISVAAAMSSADMAPNMTKIPRPRQGTAVPAGDLPENWQRTSERRLKTLFKNV